MKVVLTTHLRTLEQQRFGLLRNLLERETLQTTKLTNSRLHVSYNKDKPILLQQANMELGKKTGPASVPEVSVSYI